MEEQPYKKPVFPDIQRERIKKALESKEWGNCPKCSWFYRFKVLERCPMCRHPHKLGVSYQQPPYESSSLS
jgi:hypothetical protein